jgi:DNA-binding NtrC family response regulator
MLLVVPMQPAPGAPPDPRPHAILVVDDEPDVAESLRGLLQSNFGPHADVTVAASAEEASRALHGQHFDLVLCDYKLPGKSGVEFLRETREQSPATRRVLITAFADLTVAVEAINDAAVDNFVEKPFDPEELVGKVEGLLEEKRARELRERAFSRALDALRKRVESNSAGRA